MPALRSWLDLAQEVVVVDSESSDGTVEFLQSELRHPNLRFLSHPPGLYQSWNFGIRNLNTSLLTFRQLETRSHGRVFRA
jgi:glycosyltransferase involved in cell wall biosynthesis